MKPLAYPLGEVPYALLLEHPVWEFMPESATRDETWVRPVSRVPVGSLSGRVVSSFVHLANGQRVLAVIGNIEIQDPAQNEQFITLAVIKPDGSSFDLARYYDVDYKRRGPKGLAAFLNLTLEEVFPIKYDLSPVAKGKPTSLQGIIPLKPRVRWSQAKRLAVALGTDVA